MSALKEIKDRLKEHQQQEIEDVEEMDLSEIKIGSLTPEITKYLDKFKSVKVIIFQNCGLENLNNLPKWDLYVMDLSDNKLTDSDIKTLTAFKELNQLILSNNQIKTLESLKVLSSLENLSEVDFTGNPIAQEKEYRKWLFENIPTLQIVDSMDKDGNVVEEEEQFEDGSDDEDEEDDDEEEDYDEEESQQSEKPKKKKK